MPVSQLPAGDIPADARPGPTRVEIIGIPGLPEVSPGDDLAAAIITALDRIGVPLLDGDVLVVSSKIVSKAEGLTEHAVSRDDAIDAETVRVVAERAGSGRVTRIVQAKAGPVLAAAGVDASNVAPGTVLLLPRDPDAAAAALRHEVEAATAVRVGVVVSDTGGRAWREGQVDFALGAAGVRVVDDLRGTTDTLGNSLTVTVRALADELAAAADLVKGKVHRVPVAVVRGLRLIVSADDGPGARSLLRRPATDWFALGHVEAVRSSLGVPPGTDGVAAVPLAPDGVVPRLHRALDVALAAPDPFGCLLTPAVQVAEELAGGAAAVLPLTPSADGSAPGNDSATLLAIGALAQRAIAAAWAEGLSAQVDATGERLLITARLRQ